MHLRHIFVSGASVNDSMPTAIKNVPSTVAVIPDGNRRWARKHNRSILSGYRLGVKKFLQFGEWCREYGIRNVTVWAFSTENVQRPDKEIDTLFRIYEKAARSKKVLSKLRENQVRFNVVGDLSFLPANLRKALIRVQEQTKNYKDWVVNILINYGGREDIVYAVKEYAKEVIGNGGSQISDDAFKRYLLSNSVPDIDLVIRTSKEERLSGLLPWQTGYSELYFSNKLWPDFDKKDLEKALLAYSRRQRRFGH